MIARQQQEETKHDNAEKACCLVFLFSALTVLLDVARRRYTQGELDMDLVETSSKLALHFFKSRGRKGGSISEVRDFIKAKGVITCDLTVEEVQPSSLPSYPLPAILLPAPGYPPTSSPL